MSDPMEGPARRDRFLEEHRRFQTLAGWSAFALFVSFPVFVFLGLVASPYVVWAMLGVILVWSVWVWSRQRRRSRFKHGFWVDVNSVSIMRMVLLPVIGVAIGVGATVLMAFYAAPSASPRASLLVMVVIAVFGFNVPLVVLANRYRRRLFRDVQMRFVRAHKQAVMAALAAALGSTGVPTRFDERVKIGLLVGPGFHVSGESLRLVVFGARAAETTLLRTAISAAAIPAVERAVDEALERLDGTLV